MPTSALEVKEQVFRTEYMQPFVDSLKDFFQAHLGVDLILGMLTVNTDNRAPFEIAGVITFSGAVTGRAVISFSDEAAMAICTAYPKIDPLPEGVLEDCVGEIANVIVGRAKSALTHHSIVISPPTVVRGTDFSIAPQRGAACLSIPCECALGALQLDISMINST